MQLVEKRVFAVYCCGLIQHRLEITVTGFGCQRNIISTSLGRLQYPFTGFIFYMRRFLIFRSVPLNSLRPGISCFLHSRRWFSLFSLLPATFAFINNPVFIGLVHIFKFIRDRCTCSVLRPLSSIASYECSVANLNSSCQIVLVLSHRNHCNLSPCIQSSKPPVSHNCTIADNSGEQILISVLVYEISFAIV